MFGTELVLKNDNVCSVDIVRCEMPDESDKILVPVVEVYRVQSHTQFYSMLLNFTQSMLIGYDDHCIPEEWCVDSNESPGFQCIHKSSVLLILLFHVILYLIFILD